MKADACGFALTSVLVGGSMVLVLMAIGRVVLRIFGRGGACRHCLGA
jgi:hypothetical protein